MKKNFEDKIIKIAKDLEKLGTRGSIFLHGFTEEDFDSLSKEWEIAYKPENQFRGTYLSARYIKNGLDIALFTKDL